jgi:alkylated DNA repair protein alkB family protein 6
VFNYYRYEGNHSSGNLDQEVEQNASSMLYDASNHSKSRPIHPQPVASLLLEPRSLVITSDDLYSTHLHGIDAVATDHLAAHGPDRQSVSFGVADSADETVAMRVANWEMLGGDDEIVRVVREGGVLKRGTRTSLTCRVVERVASSGIGGSSWLLGRTNKT